MKKISIFFFLLLFTGCTPIQPDTEAKTISTEIISAETTGEIQAEEPEKQIVQPGVIRWEYKTLVAIARVGGPAGEKINVGKCVDSSDAGSAIGTICFSEDTSSALLEQLNKLGADGWELVKIIYSPENDAAAYFFKRLVSPP